MSSKNATPFNLPEEIFEFGRQLGSGSYGTVQSFKDLRSCVLSSTGKSPGVAVKRIPNAFDDFLITRRTLREIRLMRHFSNPNIIDIVDVFMTRSEKPDPEKIKKNHNIGYEAPQRDLYLVSELMDYDLDQMIRSRKEITPKHVKSFIYQILSGLKFLHAGHVIHRDLKPANIFVRKDGCVKLGDLGLARAIDLDVGGHPIYPEKECLTEYVVTRWYRAPEILILRGCYGPICDVWSVGCILYEMIMRTVLLAGKGGYDQVWRILNVTGVYPDVSWLENTVEAQNKHPEDFDRNTKICHDTGTHAKGVIEKISNDVHAAVPSCMNHRDSRTIRVNHGARDKIKAHTFTIRNPDPIVLVDKRQTEEDLNAKIGYKEFDLIERMLQFNPEKRIPVDEAMHHPMFAGFEENSRAAAREVKEVRKIDMMYDMEYDQRASDSKNIPPEYRQRLAKQLQEEVADFALSTPCAVMHHKYKEQQRKGHQARQTQQQAQPQSEISHEALQEHRRQERVRCSKHRGEVSPSESDSTAGTNSTKTYSSSSSINDQGHSEHTHDRSRNNSIVSVDSQAEQHSRVSSGNGSIDGGVTGVPGVMGRMSQRIPSMGSARGRGGACEGAGAGLGHSNQRDAYSGRPVEQKRGTRISLSNTAEQRPKLATTVSNFETKNKWDVQESASMENLFLRNIQNMENVAKCARETKYA